MVAVIRDNQDPRQAEEFLDELRIPGRNGRYRECETLYAAAAAAFGPHRRPGKLEEIAGYCREQQIDVVIFDDELSPSQTRNIEKPCPAASSTVRA